MSTQVDTAPSGLSLAEQAYRTIRDRLIMLDIAPGEPINEARLAEELGFGRTPVREALKRLEIDHLVASFPRRGTFATAVDITELAAISEVRQLLEPLAARKAALNTNDQVRTELQDVAAGLEALDGTRSRRELMEYDLEVHRLIYRAAGNHHLQESLTRLDNLATRIWCMVLDRLPAVEEHITEHSGLIRAILAGDAEGAESLAADHVGHFEQMVRAAL
ncbi:MULTISPECIES: GntR family transcriptional regulator [Micrococcaceae]|mgnify:CR=1 FL=1|uniref:GntR family transcriptional regulator n=1 Tax=Micrococcaceae TaxID=1268 RepID=UPI00160C520C|nr:MULTISPECIES: GntR family transcriptional regulator [Micrococcaceae]MBB5750772.1 DNA-binding GntR family transcriptional regulator [Micrococcus sp. TA1]HRO31166.1 GntR family transcriptional regulator [Citricoccus sp.]HRO95132.1 GntR family transcriptional regulator [Citricoccus sp.]